MRSLAPGSFVPYNSSMGRIKLAAGLIGLVLVAPACLSTSQASTTGNTPKVTLTGQQKPNRSGHWKTVRTAIVTCGTSPTVQGSKSSDPAALCSAISYYVHHPEKPCSFGPPSEGPTGDLIYREHIKGQVAGKPTDIWIRSYTMCNETGRIAAAMKLIGEAVAR